MPVKIRMAVLVSLIIFISMLCVDCRADTVWLKNGGRITGIIVKETNDTVVLDIGGGTVSHNKKTISRIEMAQGMIKALETEYSLLKKDGPERIITEWKGMSAMPGSRIKVILHDIVMEGVAHDIDPDGSLVLRLDSGILKKVWSGDVVMVR